jgi:hypothetical protein
MSSVRGNTPRKSNESQTPLLTPEPSSRPSPNTFANKRENQLGSDMMVLAEAMHLELNTQTMLAYYDARTLEDFCTTYLVSRSTDDTVRHLEPA